jgi:hypothetical protein
VVDQLEAGLTAAVSSLRFDFVDQPETSSHDLSVSTLCAGGLLVGYACLSASNSHRAKQKKYASWPFAIMTEPAL